MRLALLFSTEKGVDAALAEAVAMVRESYGTIAIMAVRRPTALTAALGASAGAIVPAQLLECDRTAAAELARRVAARLPDDVDGRHMAFLDWQCPRLLARLATGTVDRALLAERPLNPLARRALVRAARAGACELLPAAG